MVQRLSQIARVWRAQRRRHVRFSLVATALAVESAMSGG